MVRETNPAKGSEKGRRRSEGRGGGRSGGRARRPVSQGFGQPPKRAFEVRFPPLEVISADEVEAIHDASVTVLEEIGMDFLHPEALSILAAGGAQVEPGSERVRFDRELVMGLVAKAPSEIRLHARNPANDVVMGGNRMAICAVASAPNVSDLDAGRRPGNFADYKKLLHLMSAINAVDLLAGYPVEPIDLPPATRHLDALAAFVTLTDKAFHAYSLGRARILDGIEIARIARGIDAATLEREPSVFSIINTSSPLRLDGPMIEGMIELGRLNQPVAITPFTLSGAMAPASIAGALTQQNAEALAAVAFAQMIRPGTPVLYGGFTSNVDMKSGAPAFGTPEYAKAVLAGGQLARRYGLPYRSSNVNASNCVDAQAAYESQMSLWPVMLAHANMMMHGLGWLEGGLVASFEKVMLDAEMIQMMAEFLRPLDLSENAIGLDAIREVGPGGHFFGAAHTLERYETAFYPPILSDWRNFESWREAGALDTAQRANRLYKAVLEEFEPPPLDPAVAEELESFVERRRREGGAEAA
jgi:trimethylamine--corrinoid protein Co-methyltransferase